MPIAEAKIPPPTREPLPSLPEDDSVDRAADHMLDALGPLDTGEWDAVIADLEPAR